MNTHSATVGDFTHPSQSPDGTKAAVRSDWLNPGTAQSDLFVAVAYWPHPPEITSVGATGGTVEECRDALQEVLVEWLVSAYENREPRMDESELAWLSLYLHRTGD